MRNIAFVVWMVGMPLVSALDEFIDQYLLGNRYPDSVTCISALIYLVIYFFIGYKLYEGKK